ncbi:hypothetical protein Lade_1592 [Legionella adelaidensis]|uniref:Uncharacterized protein n=2 Tax=Legionella adelaidensis TaxID=45056 RepID=A0A0W0R232_9GAMM|nr:hypothetical protein Lade_1592 [Legionella adelaidensis]
MIILIWILLIIVLLLAWLNKRTLSLYSVYITILLSTIAFIYHITSSLNLNL